MSQRSQYWSCTAFADRIRGIKKGGAKTGRGWHEWKQEGKKLHPIRYWIAEEALDAVQNFIWWPVDKLYDLKYYVNNRWISKTHTLGSNLKRGQWHEFDTRLLHSMFDSMVDYIEIEEAWSNIAWDKAAREKYKAPFYARGWFRWRTWRCPQAGIDKLQWASSLTNEEFLDEDKKHLAKPTHQALTARELLFLYNWWKNIRPQRPDPHDASGWTEYCDIKRKEFNDTGVGVMCESNNPETRKLGCKALKLSHKIEKQYDREDEQMMIRLVRIRRGMWT